MRDPVEFELFRTSVSAIADEMAVTIGRAAYSGILRDIMDYSTGVTDAQGRLVAMGLTLPGHLGSIPTALATVQRRFEGDLHEGDVVVMNDPFDGGMHLPDVFAFRPVFAEGRIVAFAATVCHQADIGGRVPGSMASDSTEIYQEGLRLPPLKLYERGRRNESLVQLIEKNVRIPVTVMGDIRAQLSGLAVAERQVVELARRSGADRFEELLGEVIDHGERMARQALAALPDGVASFEDWIDGDGVENDRRIRLFCTVTKKGDGIALDWAGSSPQVRGAINATLSFTKAASYCAVKSILPQDVPANDGVFGVIQVTAPAGTVANVVHPGACAQRGVTGFRMLDCAWGALAQLAPERVCAASDGGVTVVSMGGWRADRTPFVYVDAAAAAWGGRPWADGLDGVASMFANMAAQSVELIEAEQPIRVESWEFLIDRAGPGKFRGGVPYAKHYRFLEEAGLLQVRGDRLRVRPYGLAGGRPGKPSANLLNDRLLTPKAAAALGRGDLFRCEWAGGGGWGDPLERDPALVERDLRDGYVSAASAREDYGVVPGDAAATRTLRERLRRVRGWSVPPAVSWTDEAPAAQAAE